MDQEAKRKYNHEYHIKHKEIINKRARKHYVENKEYAKEWAKDYKNRNKEKAKIQMEKWRSKNKDYIKEYREKHKERQRLYFIEHAYGLNSSEYNELLIKQEYRCAICGRHQSEFGKNLAVDHNHKTNKTRELLCDNCNFILGHSKDNPDLLQKAVDYLRKWSHG